MEEATRKPAGHCGLSKLVHGARRMLTCLQLLSSILAVLYAFQQEDWRCLLSLSSAENASIAVTALGAAMLFHTDRQPLFAGLAWSRAYMALLDANAPGLMQDGMFLVPVTKSIPPTMLVIAMPIPALLPIALLLISRGRIRPRRVPTWYGGRALTGDRTATTALTFSNALRTFYSFIYRPVLETTRQTNVRDYFVTRLVFTHRSAPVFGPAPFTPIVRLVKGASNRLRLLQSGHLNFCLTLIGGLLVLILALTLA